MAVSHSVFVLPPEMGLITNRIVIRIFFISSPNMDQSTVINNKYSPPLIKKIREKLFHWIRLTNRPVVKVYNGYGGNGEIIIYGHVLILSPLPRKKYRRNIWTNTLALLRLFIIKPIPG